MVDTNPFVVVISLDFSKAFDTVRHSMLLTKMAELHMPLPVYNWLVSFFDGHPHRTVYNGGVSSTMSISASIVQGSSLGPASYTVTAADLKPLYADNQFVKYAEDTYLVVPAYSIHTCTAKLDHIAAWTTENNLMLIRTSRRKSSSTTAEDGTSSTCRRYCLASPVSTPSKFSESHSAVTCRRLKTSIV